MNTTARIGDRVRALRTKRGWTQLDLAKKAGVSRLSIVYLENGHLGSVKSTTMSGLSCALGVSLDYLDGRRTRKQR